MKVIYKFLGGFLLVILLAGFLSLGYFKTNTQSVVEAAVPDVGQIEPVGTGFGVAVCDRIIPIGEPLERMVNLLATVYEANQNTFYNVDMASKTLTNIYANLNKEENAGAVCDWKKCSPNFADLGPTFALELDAVVKKWRFDGSVPLVSEKECTGSPCPNLGDAQDTQLATILNKAATNLTGEGSEAQKKAIGELTALSEIGTLIGLEAIVGRQEQIVKDLFNEANPTEEVPDDLAQGDAGAKISKTAMIQRMAAKAATMIKACTLSETEKKMVLSGRMGDRYPLTCQAALENGQYWPLAWSEFCQAECAANQAGSDKCIKCLQEDRFRIDTGEASTLAQLNYEIYNQCESDFFAGKDADGKDIVITKDACYNETTGDWNLSEACMECLCTRRETTKDVITREVVKVVRKEMTDNECLAFLCGGSAHNWTCCHQTPIDWYTFEDGTEPETQVHEIDSTAPDFSNSGTFEITSYTPPTFKMDIAITKSGQFVGPGSMAVDERVVPLGSCIKIKKINKLDFLNRAWDTVRGLPSLEDILANTPLYNMSFCANDIGDKTKKENIVGNRMDLWLPSHREGDAWGRRDVDIEWWYDSGNLCNDENRPYTTVCGTKPTLGTIEANDLTFASGIQKQYADASPALKVLLTCLEEKYPSGWVINSISNSGVGAYNRCAQNWTDLACAHAKNSCHYGGLKCKGNGSMAIDVSAKVGVNGKNILAATCECAKDYDLGKVTARQEENPLHYHISVKNDTCGCDGGATAVLPDSVCKK